MMKRNGIFLIFLALGIVLAALCLVSNTTPDLDLSITSCYANDDDTEVIESYIGYLSSRTERIGTRSEGPEYYLSVDGKEIHVVKNAQLWEEDPVLQELVGRKVWISGTLVDGELFYEEIKPVYG
jgi:hypothetical protein